MAQSTVLVGRQCTCCINVLQQAAARLSGHPQCLRPASGQDLRIYCKLCECLPSYFVPHTWYLGLGTNCHVGRTLMYETVTFENNTVCMFASARFETVMCESVMFETVMLETVMWARVGFFMNAQLEQLGRVATCNLSHH